MTNLNVILQLADAYEDKCLDLVKLAKIRKMPDGKYHVLSEKGKNMGAYVSKEKAKKRLRQIEYFKHFDHFKAEDKSNIIDLTDIDEFTYSAIMRKLRQKAEPEAIKKFLTIFKLQFDKAVKNKIHKPDRIALQNTMVKFNKFHKVKLDAKMVKCAAVAELGNADQVGKYLSDIVKFILNRVPLEKRAHALEVLKQKFANMNESEISSKQLPESAVYGQSITFVKHILFGHDNVYVKEVLNSLSRSL